MAQKRRYPSDFESIDLTSSASTPKRQRVPGSIRPSAYSRASKPIARYKQHAESGVGQDFHSVPYPLSLLPKKSWEALNAGDQDAKIVCPQCGKDRVSSVHQRKLFLVAERLSWEVGKTSAKEREQNEIATWAVNAELDIFDPAVDEDEVVVGGRRSKDNEWYPYDSQEEASMAMMVVEKADILTERSWQCWLKTINSKLQDLQGNKSNPDAYTENYGTQASSRAALNEISPNSRTSRTPPRKKGKEPALPTSSLPTPPSSAIDEDGDSKSIPVKCSYQTLQHFYSLLDKIERTSPQGARYLEAYAEHLNKDACRDCWFKQIIVDLPDDLEVDVEDGDDEVVRERQKDAGPHPPHPVKPMDTAVHSTSRHATQPRRLPPHGHPRIHSDRLPISSPPPPQAPNYQIPYPPPGYPAPYPPPYARYSLPNSLHGPPQAPLAGMYDPRNPLSRQVPTGMYDPRTGQYSLAPDRDQTNYVPSAPLVEAWLHLNFLADPDGAMIQASFYEVYRQAMGISGPPTVAGATEFITKILPRAFPSVNVRAERFPDGSYVVRGILPKLSRDPGLVSIVHPSSMRGAPQQYYMIQQGSRSIARPQHR